MSSKTIVAVDQVTRRVVLTFRRFNWPSVIRLLEATGFRIRFARASVTTGAERFGMGVLLLSNG